MNVFGSCCKWSCCCCCCTRLCGTGIGVDFPLQAADPCGDGCKPLLLRRWAGLCSTGVALRASGQRRARTRRCPCLLAAGLCSTGSPVRVLRVAPQDVHDGGASLPLGGYARLCSTDAVQRPFTCAPSDSRLFSTARGSCKCCRLFSTACTRFNTARAHLMVVSVHRDWLAIDAAADRPWPSAREGEGRCP